MRGKHSALIFLDFCTIPLGRDFVVSFIELVSGKYYTLPIVSSVAIGGLANQSHWNVEEVVIPCVFDNLIIGMNYYLVDYKVNSTFDSAILPHLYILAPLIGAYIRIE